MSNEGRDLLETVQWASRESPVAIRPPAVGPQFVPWSALPAAEQGTPLAEEWETYRREVGQWLAEGQAGRYALIKRQEIVGLYDTWQAAREEGLRRYLLEPFFVHLIRAEEPCVRIRGHHSPCLD